jgi:hypothetical protein
VDTIANQVLVSMMLKYASSVIINIEWAVLGSEAQRFG